MTIALVAAHFFEDLGYQEVYLARALSRLGHRVTVLTSTHVPPSVRSVVRVRPAPGTRDAAASGYVVTRLAPFFAAGALVWSRGLSEELQAIRPDLVLVVGPGTLFPLPAFVRRAVPTARIISLFGDNQDYFRTGSPRQQLLAWRMRIVRACIKRPAYRRAFARSDVVVAYTPDTRAMLLQMCAPRHRTALEAKIRESTLGFDDASFWYDPDSRRRTRDSLGLDDATLLVLSATRVSAGKGLEEVVDAVAECRGAGAPMRLVMAGFTNDAYGASLRARIHAAGIDGAVSCLPFQDKDAMRALYCAADVGVWRNAAITIQEAMGTGLFVLLPAKRNVAHLLTRDEYGAYSAPGELAAALRVAGDSLLAQRPDEHVRRQRIAQEHASRLAYVAVVRDIIA